MQRCISRERCGGKLTCTLSFLLPSPRCSMNQFTSSALVMSFSASICCTSRKRRLCPSIFPQFIINTLLSCQTLPMCSMASHLSAESVKDVLLRDHLCPVPVHLLAEMSVFATLQLDESSHLCLKSLITQAAHLFSKAHQKLLNLCLHQLSARMQKMRREKEFLHIWHHSEILQSSN